jgi:hypothetical protein
MDILTEAVGCDYFYPNFEGDNDFVQFYFEIGAATSMVYDNLTMTISVLLMEEDQP